MNIAVNTRLLIKNKLEGIGWFTYETLKRICIDHPEHNFIFFFDRKFSDEFIFSENITPVVVHPQARHPILWYLYFDWGIPKALKKYKADLFLSPDGWLSLRTDVKSMAVIHDLNFEHYPEFIPYHVRQYYKYFFHRFAKKASRIATVSEFTKKDISEKYGIQQDLIDVVYNGANESFSPVSEDVKNDTKLRFSKSCPYFLSIGLIHPRKNTANLFRSFDKFKINDDQNFKLLIVGEKKWWTSEIKEAFEKMRFQDEVIFTQRLNSQELGNVIASAFCMVYVSFFEGFGIPILEAFYCDVPLITSNVTSMPEIAGDAAIFTDPSSVDSISDAMTQITKDEQLRKELIHKGKIRRQNFSWQLSAEKLWNSIDKTLKI